MKPRRIARWTSALSCVVALSACASVREHVSEHQGKQTLRLVNATATPICEVHVASEREHLWGPSWISEPVAAGGHVDLPVRPDDYILRVGDCHGGTKVVASHVPIEGDLAVVVHDGYPRAVEASPMRQLALPAWTFVDGDARHLASATARSGVELRVQNRCALDLRVVLGGDPKAQTGAPSTLPARATLEYYAPEGTDLWLVDPEYNVVARTELSDDQRRVSVAPTCDAFIAS
jgi:hypothetical protein